MGKGSTDKAQFSKVESLIDFLYVDKERVDSFISQIRSGTLRSVTKTSGVSESSSLSGLVNMHVAKGTIQNGETNQSSASEQYDPYHFQILNLINDLGLRPLDDLESAIGDTPKLVLFNGYVSIRDMVSIKTISTLFLKRPQMLG